MPLRVHRVAAELAASVGRAPRPRRRGATARASAPSWRAGARSRPVALARRRGRSIVALALRVDLGASNSSISRRKSVLRLVVAERQPPGPPSRVERLLELHLGLVGTVAGLERRRRRAARAPTPRGAAPAASRRSIVTSSVAAREPGGRTCARRARRSASAVIRSTGPRSIDAYPRSLARRAPPPGVRRRGREPREPARVVHQQHPRHAARPSHDGDRRRVDHHALERVQRHARASARGGAARCRRAWRSPRARGGACERSRSNPATTRSWASAKLSPPPGIGTATARAARRARRFVAGAVRAFCRSTSPASISIRLVARDDRQPWRARQRLDRLDASLERARVDRREPNAGEALRERVGLGASSLVQSIAAGLP